jgi:hypothetical protein
LKKLTENLYRVYYRIYYLLIAVRIINNPKVTYPSGSVNCIPVLNIEKHENFLFVQVDDEKSFLFLKLFFWKRKFAFRLSNEIYWKELPSMTPWGIEEDKLKYGLNHTFVLKHLSELGKLEFCSWY